VVCRACSGFERTLAFSTGGASTCSSCLAVASSHRLYHECRYGCIRAVLRIGMRRTEIANHSD